MTDFYLLQLSNDISSNSSCSTSPVLVIQGWYRVHLSMYRVTYALLPSLLVPSFPLPFPARTPSPHWPQLLQGPLGGLVLLDPPQLSAQ